MRMARKSDSKMKLPRMIHDLRVVPGEVLVTFCIARA